MSSSLSFPHPSTFTPASRKRVLFLCGLLAAAVFCLDFLLPLGVAEAVPYVAVILISLWSGERKDTLYVAIACSILTVIGFFVSPEGSSMWIAETNRGLALFAIWATTVLGLKIQEADASVRDKSQMLTGILSNMPSVIFRLDEHGYMVHTMGKGLSRLGFYNFEVPGRNGLEPPPYLLGQLKTVSPGKPVFYESHGVHEGSPWWFYNCVMANPLKAGEIIGFGLDITEKKRAERRLATYHGVTTTLEDCKTFTEAAPKLLQVICENLGWELGAIWNFDSSKSVLHCIEVWTHPGSDLATFESRTKNTTFALGTGLPGRVWESGHPAWISDVVQDTNFPRAQVAEQEGLHAGMCFPVSVKSEIRCVLEFFSREIEEPDKELLTMFAALGLQIGHFIEYKSLDLPAK